jgi:small subunit ribosomal protein S16
MVKIRLKRLGYKRNPIYRVVVINSTSKREGRPIEELGYYNPKHKELKLDKEAALAWINKGAQPTDTVKYLIDNCDDEGKLVKKQAEGEKKLSKKAQAKAEAEAKEKAEAEAKAKEEAKAAKEAAKAEAEAAKAAAKEEAEAAKAEVEAPVEEVVEETTEEAEA